MLIKETYSPACMPTIRLGYALTLPSDYKEGEQLPMIVFLHGVGERGDDIDRVGATGFARLFMQDPDYGGHRVITLSPQCPESVIWTNITLATKELIDTIAARYGADRSHIALTGLSMGGYGTWDLATAFPDFFSCIAPICGGGITWRAGLIAHLPIRAFHSEHEQIVICENSRMMVDAVNACGGNATLTLYDSADHNCWDEVYQHTDVISWLTTAVPEKRV